MVLTVKCPLRMLATVQGNNYSPGFVCHLNIFKLTLHNTPSCVSDKVTINCLRTCSAYLYMISGPRNRCAYGGSRNMYLIVHDLNPHYIYILFETPTPHQTQPPHPPKKIILKKTCSILFSARTSVRPNIR